MFAGCLLPCIDGCWCVQQVLQRAISVMSGIISYVYRMHLCLLVCIGERVDFLCLVVFLDVL